MGLAGKECTLRGIWRVCIKDFSTFSPLKPHILLGLQWYRDALMIHDISSQNMIVNIQSRYHNIMFQLNVCYINKILKSLSLIFLPRLCILALAGQFVMKPKWKAMVICLLTFTYLSIWPAGIIENFVPETTDPTLVSCNNIAKQELWPGKVFGGYCVVDSFLYFSF